MVDLEIDGKNVSVPEGSMVMHAAAALGIYVPHFCYHKKLSIAANCRMCLVEVEKAPKALPACATPVTKGMKVYTSSKRAIDAQKSVMEFLLINHPLDCPICDQGGECQLQDLAVGYGASGSVYHEEKRVVFHKNIGPLVAAEEMTRCIQCTRCVRFGQEVAGVMELGMQGRGEHSEILSFLGRSVDSEMSGNMIDICPVGALTSKPFRYTARSWELRRRRSVSPHDSTGANLVVQAKQDRVMRVLPFENEEVNECWISDKDRFSYEAIHSEARLTAPMIKQNNEWREVSWESALEYAAHALREISQRHGGPALGGLLSPHSTSEELWLASTLMRGLGCDNIDFRLRQSDFSGDESATNAPRVPWLGMPIAELSSLDSVLFIGSFLRKDHPLLATRVRTAARSGMAVSSLHAVADDWLMPMAARLTLSPDRWISTLEDLLKGLESPAGDDAGSKGDAARNEASNQADAQRAALLASLRAGGADGRRAILLGNAAVQHPRYQELLRLARAIGERVGARVGVIGEAANSVGAHLVGARPRSNGVDAIRMLREPRKAYLLMNVEPTLDLAEPQVAMNALHAADSVISLSSFRSKDLMEVADCLLPIGTFAETGGSFVNTEGRLQSFQGVVRPHGQARPGWKVLRVLANRLGLSGFDEESVDEVRQKALGNLPTVPQPARQHSVAGRPDEGSTDKVYDLNTRTIRTEQPVANPGSRGPADGAAAAAGGSLRRIADVPIHFADPLVRHAPSLQRTRDARTPTARLSQATLSALGFAQGDAVRVRAVDDGRAGAAGAAAAAGLSGSAHAADAADKLRDHSPTLMVERDDAVADGCVLISAAHPSTAGLPSMSCSLNLERA